jgi:hypothetical protein
MKFSDPIDAIRHAEYRAFISGRPWGVYAADQYIVAPLGDLSEAALLEVCQP